MLRRKRRRIAHGADSVDTTIDNTPQEGKQSIFAGLRSKWGKASIIGGLSPEKSKEAPSKAVSRRLPGIRLRARMLVKKVKETWLKVFSSRVHCKRDSRNGDTPNVKRTHQVAMSSVRTGGRTLSRCGSATTKQNNQHHQYKLCHHNYAKFPSVANEDAIADCLEFIKRSSSSSSSSSSVLSCSSAASSSSSVSMGLHA